jgi:hypothetical protein
VSDARVESTFLANDAACLTLIRAAIQLRCFEVVFLGCGLLSCIVGGVSSMGLGQMTDSASPDKQYLEGGRLGVVQEDATATAVAVAASSSAGEGEPSCNIT